MLIHCSNSFLLDAIMFIVFKPCLLMYRWLVFVLFTSRKVVEIRFHGRGGQGAVTAANVLVGAALRDNLWGLAIPFFGAERRGAPVLAFARIGKSREVIRIRSAIKEPDIVVVLDPKLPKLVNVFTGLKKGGYFIINSSKDVEVPEGIKGFRVDANKIAMDLGLVLAGWPLVNTAMLGALSKVTGLVSLDSIVDEVLSRLSGKVAELNAEAVKRAYNEVTPIG